MSLLTSSASVLCRQLTAADSKSYSLERVTGEIDGQFDVLFGSYPMATSAPPCLLRQCGKRQLMFSFCDA